ncbi:phage capsid protein [Clostridium sp. LY3-2]|uniref:phage capsid protein n=1 Tax=Clostridium sp. LY3-2 TaxID=2942482 RepID=UPI0021522961|nr:phage capsid protein [Clostridium sp. LY3-2]MCR6515303.1 phage capsid protein [Clostridium sp. LY3-2]
MSVESFKPQLWEGTLLANFHNISIADAITSKPTDIKGNKVTFNRIGSGTVKDYEGSIAWDDINTTPIDMTFEQKKYFAFSLEDVDKVQLKGDVMKATTAEHAAVLAETYDGYVLSKLASNKKNVLAAKELTPLNVYDAIVDMGTKLSKNKVPKTDRFVTVDAEILGLLSKDARFTKNPSVLANGFVEGQKINGMQVMASEELPTNTIVAHHKSAIGAAKQLSETEAMRLQSSFADGIRGLCVYDSVILREDAIVTQKYTLNPNVTAPQPQA